MVPTVGSPLADADVFPGDPTSPPPVYTPEAPTNLAATAIDTGSIRITWDTMAEASSYQLFGDGQLLYSGPARTYDHTGLSPLESVLYMAVSFYPDGQMSVPSSGVIGTTLSEGYASLMDQSGGILTNAAGGPLIVRV